LVSQAHGQDRTIFRFAHRPKKFADEHMVLFAEKGCSAINVDYLFLELHEHFRLKFLGMVSGYSSAINRNLLKIATLHLIVQPAV
jgi:hypothetical protein